MTSFRDLKKSREAMFDKLNQAIDNDKGGFAKDPRYWEPTLDKSGNGYAVVRFLSAPKNEVLPYVKIFSYNFKGKGGRYVQPSPQTIGEPCPVQEHWSDLWNEGRKEEAKMFKRSASYVSNIYIVSDPAFPENNGKVFLYRYGVKIFERFESKMKPQFEHETPMNPFDLWEGANFEIRITTKDRTTENPKGYRNYDTSVFQTPSPLNPSDDAMEAIWNEAYPLVEMVSADKFLPYDELKVLFRKAIGVTSETPDMPSASAPSGDSIDSMPKRSTSDFGTQHADQPAWNGEPDEDEEDPDIAEYRRLANL